MPQYYIQSVQSHGVFYFKTNLRFKATAPFVIRDADVFFKYTNWWGAGMKQNYKQQ
jgi:hypothetical protein